MFVPALVPPHRKEADAAGRDAVVQRRAVVAEEEQQRVVRQAGLGDIGHYLARQPVHLLHPPPPELQVAVAVAVAVGCDSLWVWLRTTAPQLRIHYHQA